MKRARAASTSPASPSPTRCRKPKPGSTNSSPKACTATWRGWRPAPTARLAARTVAQVRSVIMLGINYGPSEDPLGDPGAKGPRRHLDLCQRRRLPRADQIAAERAGALAGRECRRRSESVCRYRRGNGKASGRASRSRLAGQAHQFGLPSIRLLAFPGLDLHHARASCRSSRAGQLRKLPRLPRHLPDGCVPRALPARCAALYLVSDHRA